MDIFSGLIFSFIIIVLRYHDKNALYLKENGTNMIKEFIAYSVIFSIIQYYLKSPKNEHFSIFSTL